MAGSGRDLPSRLAIFASLARGVSAFAIVGLEGAMPLRIAFMGSPDFAVPTLEAVLAAGHDVACVYSQPPRPAGRGKQVQRTPVHEAAERHGIEVRTPENFRAQADRDAFAALKLDTAVV